jgi:hypothetical protein
MFKRLFAFGIILFILSFVPFVAFAQTAPGAPILKNPAAGAVVPLARPSFSWFAVNTAKRYRLEIARDSEFLNMVSRSESDFLAAAPVTLPLGRYFWHVQARNAAGAWGPFSETRYFDLSIMRTPVNNTDTHTHRPRFQWYPYAGARRYQLQVSTDAGFDVPVSDCVYRATILSAEPCGVDLPYNYYYWRVNVDAGQGFVVSPLTWVLLVNPKNIWGPTPLSPIGSIQTGFPIYTWTAVPGAFAYEIQVSMYSDFRNLKFAASGIVETSIQSSDLSEAKTFYWRVRARLPETIFTRWGPTATFTIP